MFCGKRERAREREREIEREREKEKKATAERTRMRRREEEPMGAWDVQTALTQCTANCVGHGSHGQVQHAK